MDTLFHIFSKIFWMACAPDMLLVFLMVLCLILFWFRSQKSLILLHLIVAVFILLSFLPVGKWTLYPLENRFMPPTSLPKQIDGILVLGGAERLDISSYWNQPETNGHAERLFSFIHLIRQYPDAKRVYSGGIGGLDRNLPTASNMVRQLFETQGVDVEAIFFEDTSRNTYENALQTKKMLDPAPGETWLLITSAFHMPRAIGAFNQNGWHMIPYPVDHQVNPDRLFKLRFSLAGNMVDLKNAVHEWVGLAAYYATGKSRPLFPGPKTESYSQ